MDNAESIGTLTWELNDNGVLTILGTGDLAPSSPSSLPWYSSRSSITTVVIGAGVTSIGTYAFYNCNNLREITIPSKVTSIGNNAFSGCWAITTVKIQSGVTRIQPHTFSACSALQSVEIPIGCLRSWKLRLLCKCITSDFSPGVNSNDRGLCLLILRPAERSYLCRRASVYSRQQLPAGKGKCTLPR